MIVEQSISIVLFLWINIINGTPSNSYYLIDINTNISSNKNYCSNIFIKNDLYHIPNQCHQHIRCDRFNCDDKSFRCMKIRDMLCCLHKYIINNCQYKSLKDEFRSIYFYISIQHGHCEINLERIEQNDPLYCLDQNYELTTISLFRRHFHRHRHRLATPLSNQNYLRYLTHNKSSKSSFTSLNLIILLFTSILL